MKRVILSLLCVVSSMLGFASDDEALNQSISNIAKDLFSKHSAGSKTKVAILQFRTNKNQLNPFNAYIQDQLVLNYQNTKFEVIDQNIINGIVDEFGWNLDNCTDFKAYSDLSEAIFRKIGVVPGVFIYGQIVDNDQTITLTGYLVPNGLKSANANSTQVFSSSALTDKLLGKPVRQPKKEQPTVVIVEKPVVVEKQVIVEKEVVVEKPVYVEKIVRVEPDQDAKVPAAFSQNLGDLEFEILGVTFKGDRIEVGMKVVNVKSDDFINRLECRFIDEDGNEFGSGYADNTFRYRDLIGNVPIKGSITFKGDGLSAVNRMVVFEVSVFGKSGKQVGTLRFRDVPVTK